LENGFFQALQYLRKVCDHPKLVLDATHPEWSGVEHFLTQVKNKYGDA